MSESGWKPVFKVFHWGVAASVVLDYFWLEDALHEWAGYIALALIISRVGLGLSIKAPQYANLLAKSVYFFIWILIMALAVTGWMLGTDQYWGDEQIEALHVNLSHVLAGVILVHFAGLLRNAVWHRQNTWKGMFPKF